MVSVSKIAGYAWMLNVVVQHPDGARVVLVEVSEVVDTRKLCLLDLSDQAVLALPQALASVVVSVVVFEEGEDMVAAMVAIAAASEAATEVVDEVELDTRMAMVAPPKVHHLDPVEAVAEVMVGMVVEDAMRTVAAPVAAIANRWATGGMVDTATAIETMIAKVGMAVTITAGSAITMEAATTIQEASGDIDFDLLVQPLLATHYPHRRPRNPQKGISIRALFDRCQNMMVRLWRWATAFDCAHHLQWSWIVEVFS